MASFPPGQQESEEILDTTASQGLSKKKGLLCQEGDNMIWGTPSKKGWEKAQKGTLT